MERIIVANIKKRVIFVVLFIYDINVNIFFFIRKKNKEKEIILGEINKIREFRGGKIKYSNRI